ncbi:VIT1/CCC1 transporter family protein [Halobacterium litoreum]|uniref:VIT1/CCC1 transporter family protein n=1 Tax=Halobacterium litoreum TaxID=2039234 RepID=A0ABD5NCS8_9EURY|nr:VIT1/CCC1 transporter family protein [Halobacterium litoreum]UHH14219.1 VIT1/CCC1 transporter family protein [Halobacterium litoreum]
MRERLHRLRRVLRDDDVRSISRRYFVSNGFDGTLTSIGVVVGAYLSGVPDGTTVFKVGVGAAVGLATSGVWSVWEIERAETKLEVLRLEDAMLADLDDTRIEREKRGERVVHAVLSGLGPVVGVLVPLSPFLLEGAVFTLLEATVVGVLLGAGLLFAFGAYLGNLSEQSWLVAGARMGLAGLVVAAVNVLLG